MRIAVFGAGGVGGYFGGRLAAAGEDVWFIARGRHLEAMRAGGLKIRSGAGDLYLPAVQATDDPAAVGPVDLVIVTVKLYQTDDALAEMAPLVGPGTAVVSFQNGVHVTEALARAVGRKRVFAGTTYIMATIEDAGVIGHLGTMARFLFGELDGSESGRVGALRAACERAGIDAVASQAITAELWTKFTLLAALSGVTTLTRMPVGPIRKDPDTRALLRAAIDEAVAVARAEAVPLPGNLVDRHMVTVDGLDPRMGSSMLYDLESGRPLELPWLSGEVVRLGRAAGVGTPTHTVIYAALKLHADGQRD